jgi:hypothetical protein
MSVLQWRSVDVDRIYCKRAVQAAYVNLQISLSTREIEMVQDLATERGLSCGKFFSKLLYAVSYKQ